MKSIEPCRCCRGRSLNVPPPIRVRGELCDQLKLGLERKDRLARGRPIRVAFRWNRTAPSGASMMAPDKTAVSCLAGLPQEQEQLPKLFTADNDWVPLTQSIGSRSPRTAPIRTRRALR